MKPNTPEFISSFDGTRLAVYDVGPRDAPVVFLVNGLGGTVDTWLPVLEHFEGRFRFISFDYRGMFKSGTPPYKDFSMEAHARDARVVLDHFEVESAIFMGWSMGVQLVLELLRKTPETARALVLLNGTFAKPLDRAFPKLKRVALVGMDVLALYAPILKVYARPWTFSRLPVKVAKLAGVVSSNLDERVFLSLAHEFIHLDFVNFRDILVALAQHDAEDVLETIQQPCLVVAGERDLFTPIETAREMTHRIPDCELLEVRDASHYALVEYPELICLRIEKFFDEQLPSPTKRKGSSPRRNKNSAR